MKNSDLIETIKSDLEWQLAFEDMDWEYFMATVNEAKEIQDRIDKEKGIDRWF